MFGFCSQFGGDLARANCGTDAYDPCSETVEQQPPSPVGVLLALIEVERGDLDRAKEEAPGLPVCSWHAARLSALKDAVRALGGEA